ncbi:hypothetical protein BDZ97DRAFT_2074501 [Flammula alnicola]|nr:hypothetical protein BDZ97DRAFT_2074501 [Flammula alnicola]
MKFSPLFLTCLLSCVTAVLSLPLPVKDAPGQGDPLPNKEGSLPGKEGEGIKPGDVVSYVTPKLEGEKKGRAHPAIVVDPEPKNGDGVHHDIVVASHNHPAAVVHRRPSDNYGIAGTQIDMVPISVPAQKLKPLNDNIGEDNLHRLVGHIAECKTGNCEHVKGKGKDAVQEPAKPPVAQNKEAAAPKPPSWADLVTKNQQAQAAAKQGAPGPGAKPVAQAFKQVAQLAAAKPAGQAVKEAAQHPQPPAQPAKQAAPGSKPPIQGAAPQAKAVPQPAQHPVKPVAQPGQQAPPPAKPAGKQQQAPKKRG